MNSSSKTSLSRRTLFAGAGTVGALAAAAAALPLVKPEPQPEVAKAEPPLDPAGGYQETRHVLRYYQTTRV